MEKTRYEQLLYTQVFESVVFFHSFGPLRACCCRVVGALVGSSPGWALSLQHGDSFEKGYAAMPTVSENFKRKTAASRDGKVWRVPPCIIQSSSEQHSQTSIPLNHPKRLLIRQDASDRMMACTCTMFGGPSADPGRLVVSANNLDREVKGHGKFEQRRVSNNWQTAFVR